MIVVTGGAGYIGSHCVHKLAESGAEVAVIDNLSLGHAEAVPGGVRLFRGDVADAGFMDGVFGELRPDAVMHFAAFSLVGESMKDPGKYFGNNIGGSLTLLETMKKHGVKNIVFSSTAAVYGEPEAVPITEESRWLPTNPYGESKLAVERILDWYSKAYGISYAALRYFNVAGAIEGGHIGEDHRPETHLIPRVLMSLMKSETINIYGADYDTPDGTCVRDYIHVCDLVAAHRLALDYLRAGGESVRLNLGLGYGFSVREIIDAAARVTGIAPKTAESPRREGDPAVLIASGERAKKLLGWRPGYGDVEGIIKSAWIWHSKNPDGYR